MRSLLTASALGFAALLTTGCGVSANTLSGPEQIAVPAMQGRLFGGQQPVSGSTIQLWAAGTTGYGTGATALINSTVLTDAGGSFNITGAYTCPAGSQVYITATGGNPGGGNNSALAMMAGLGPCSGLTPSTFIFINEITTVGAVWALSSFMTGTATSVNVGAPATNSAGLVQAFADISQIANTATGATPGPALPSGAVSPTAEINTLADILASCVNSSGPSSTTCSALFSAATVGNSTPANTVAAAVNIARNPTNNVQSLIVLSGPSAPFQPTLAAVNDWTLGVTYPVGTSPVSVAVDAADNVWIANTASSSVSRLTHAGAATTYASATGGLNAPTSIALDTGGNAWVANTNNSLTEISSSGTDSNYTGGGLNQPSSVAIDGLGTVWVSNGAASTVSAFSSAGTALSSASGYPTGSSNGASFVSVAINPH